MHARFSPAMRACMPEFKFSNAELEAYRRVLKCPLSLGSLQAAHEEVGTWVDLSTQSDDERKEKATKLVLILKGLGLSPQAVSEI